MIRKKLIVLLVLVAVVAGTAAVYHFLPRHYRVGENLSQITVFWNHSDAFLFLSTSSRGQSQNWVDQKIARTRYGALLTLFLGGSENFFDQHLTAYRLQGSGELARLDMPSGASTYGTWALDNGNLKLVPYALGREGSKGFKWDGQKFVALPADEIQKLKQEQEKAKLDLDDDAADDDDSGSLLAKAQRAEFVKAGWHSKSLTGYESRGKESVLPITLDDKEFDLTIGQNTRTNDEIASFDLLSYGIKSAQVAGIGIDASKGMLWQQEGWQEISKAEFEQHAGRRVQPTSGRITPVIAVVVLFVLWIWRFGGMGYGLFKMFTVKRSVLNNMATQFSFPPAIPAQFPSLDTAALERYTRDAEALGFTKLLDFSLVSDRKNPIPSFCRLFVHTRHHAFCEVHQVFPHGKSPLAMRCAVQSYLQDGWTISYSDAKPQAASSLIRRPKALGVCQPGTPISELLNQLIKMRDQVCIDLGIHVINDDSFEAYTAKVQKSADDMRQAVKNKNFVTGVPQVYLRKLALLKTDPEYVWLGDYPKEAEKRKNAYNTVAAIG